MIEQTKSFVKEVAGIDCNVGFESMKNERLGYANKNNRVIVYNLDFLKTNLDNPYYFHRVIVHESLHMVNDSHNEGFQDILAKYGPKEPKGINAPAGITFVLKCPSCGAVKYKYTEKNLDKKIYDCTCGEKGITWAPVQ